MDRRTKGIIVTTITTAVCGCLALITCVFGAFGVTQVPFETVVDGAPAGSAPMPPTWGYTLLCFSLILIAIPTVVGVITLRRQPARADVSEPLPPAS